MRRFPVALRSFLRGDKIIAAGVAGVRKAGTTAPVTFADQFEICSGAKSMTATLVALFVEEGKLSWDTTIADIFSSAVPDVHDAWKKITVREVIEHRAGFEDHLMKLARAVLAGGW